MPNPYPILETRLSQGYTVEFSMGDDRWFYLAASHPAKSTIEAAGKTIADAVIMLDSRLKDREAVEQMRAPDLPKASRQIYAVEGCGCDACDAIRHPASG
jgi:hypothetical protein